MPLPDIIEIVPPRPAGPVRVTIPGSKSITNRALVLGALAEGKTKIHGALWSEDTEIMVTCLRALGFEIEIAPDEAEDSNRTISITGLGGRIPNAGDAARPLELFVGNAGTVARFLMPLLCLGAGAYRVSGSPRMNDRPQGALFDALRQMGYRVRARGGNLPAVLQSDGPGAGSCRVSIEESSQFASALLLCSRIGGWKVSVEGENAEESPYVAMTTKMMAVFPHHGGEFQVEPDCSSASYFLAAGALLPDTRLSVAAWPESGWQVDARFRDFCARFRESGEDAPRKLSRLYDLGDSIMTAIVLAPFLDQPMKFVDLGRLRVQESERVLALRTELTKCGARVVETGDTLEIFPSELRGAEIETYGDHRIAMCFAVLGLKVPGIRIQNPGCVKKTFPDFFAKLAAPPPAGLGAHILDGVTGKPLDGDDLLPR